MVKRYQKRSSEAVTQRTDNTMVKRYQKRSSEAVNQRTDNTMTKSLKIPKEVTRSRKSKDR
jgi:hypothetical protein